MKDEHVKLFKIFTGLTIIGAFLIAGVQSNWFYWELGPRFLINLGFAGMFFIAVIAIVSGLSRE
jgi:hypothetical protein